MAEATYKDSELFRLREEITMSEKLLENSLKPIIHKNLERYTGSYIPSQETDWDVLINEFYPIVQYYMPSIFFRNPRAFLKPRSKTFIAKRRNPLTLEMEEIELDSQKSARTQEHLVNYLLSEMKYKREVRRVLFDALTAPYGVLWHGYKGEFGMTQERSFTIRKQAIFVKRLSPLRFNFDPAVTIANLDEARWVGRSFDIPLQDLIEDDTLDLDKKLLKGKVGYGQRVQELAKNGTDKHTPSQSQVLADFASKDFKSSPYSRFVTVHEIFHRPTPKESRDGQKGKVFLICEEQKKPLRVSKWPYKAEGWPIELLQFNEVVDMPLGLDDFKTYEDVADQGNIISNQQIRNARQLNKVWVAVSKENLSSEHDQEKIKRGENMVLLFDAESVSGKIAVASAAGGASSELYLLDQRIDLKRDKISGVTDLKTGIPPKSGEESATSVNIRNSGGSARPAYRQDVMSDFLKASIHKINQYNKQFMTIEEVVRIVGSLDIEWSDKPSQEEIQADVDVEIDVISMLPENPEQELKEMNTALTIAIQALTEPTGQIKQKLAQEGYTMELAPLIEQILMRLKIRNPDVFRRIKPEESQGFVSVAEVRNAKANVEAALQGAEPPIPPAEGQDHVAHLEIYTSILQLIGESAPQSVAVQILSQLTQIHQALLQQATEKQATVGTKVPSTKGFGVRPLETF